MINNVFCFAPTGKIIFACINFPGSWHDSQVSLSLISKVVEWGMRSLQGTFTRMKSRLTSIKRKRKLILSVIILLHNFRTEVVGLNQIATVFNVEYESFINIRNYDRIAQYYEHVVDSDDD